MPADDSKFSSMSIPDNIIVDASIILGWLMADERTDQLTKLFTFLLDQSVKLFAPSVLPYEITNALRSAVLRHRISQATAIALISDIDQLGLQVGSGNQMETILTIATEFDISAYDAAYVALAKQLDAPLYTLDTKLQKKVGAKITCVVLK